jgi:hypothetical protein
MEHIGRTEKKLIFKSPHLSIFVVTEYFGNSVSPFSFILFEPSLGETLYKSEVKELVRALTIWLKSKIVRDLY